MVCGLLVQDLLASPGGNSLAGLLAALLLFVVEKNESERKGTNACTVLSSGTCRKMR